MIGYLSGDGNRADLLFDKKWGDPYSSRTIKACVDNHPRLQVGCLIPRSDLWHWPLSASREMLSYASYLSRKDQSDYYLKRWEGYLPALSRLAVKSPRFRSFLASDRVRSRLRAFEEWVRPNPQIVRWLKNNRPDVMVASPVNMRFSTEVEYVKAAKALGIPTVVTVYSWDNLTTKGLFAVIPDLTLVWNRTQFDEATNIHDIPAEKIIITGAAFFDKWFGASRLLVAREAFCRKVGLDPLRPFIVYLGSSANIARDETWLVEELLNRLRRHDDPALRETGLLIRPHPANAKVYEGLAGHQVAVWPKEGALPESTESLQDFYNTLVHCAVTIGINTSGMIDALIVGKPCVTIMTERYRSTQLQAVHFRHLLHADVLEVAHSVEDGVGAIERLRNGIELKREQRRRFVEEFIRPRGIERPAGEIAAQAIKLAALGQTARQINSPMQSPN
jgi:hypothetical protein